MIEIKKIINKLESFAPLELAEEWDNSGWQINLGKTKATNVMLCLSLTSDVLKQAIEEKCDLIISHHPLIFSGIKKIQSNDVTHQLIIDCIQNDIQVYSAHTNLDATKGGVNDILCKKLELPAQETFNNFVKISKQNRILYLYHHQDK